MRASPLKAPAASGRLELIDESAPVARLRPQPARNADWVSRAYRKFGPVIYARARRMLGSASRAEDATQDVFIKVIEHLETAPDDSAALWWVKTITRNHCLNQLRTTAREPEPMEELPEPEPEQLEPSPGFAEREQVANLMRRVPRRLSVPAALFYLEGLSQDVVAQRLGVSKRMVLLLLAEFKTVSRRLLLHDERGARGAP